MTTDWRALCAGLVKELDDLRESSEGVAGFHRNGDLAPWSELGESGEFPWLSSFDRARAALAKPADAPAAVAERPSDEELRDLWSWAAGQDQGPWLTQYHCFARAVLARWGRPPPQPVAVRETWSEFSDCGQQEEVWVWNPVLDHWTLSRINRHVHTHWLPANALLTPEATNE